MKIGAICSAGGSAFFAAADIALALEYVSQSDLFVVTDRACSAEDAARERGIDQQRISLEDRNAFSAAACDAFRDAGSNCVLLYFTRLVSADLFGHIATLNIHPSLLPAFRGFGPVRAASRMKLPLLGATLHLVGDGVDDGPVISQVTSPVLAARDDAEMDGISFMQKSYLTLLALDLLASAKLRIEPAAGTFSLEPDLRVTASAAPALQSPAAIDAFAKMLGARNAIEHTFVP